MRNRLEVYREQTEPLVAFYDGRGQLRRVEAVGTVDDVDRPRDGDPRRGRRTRRAS